MYVYSIKKSNIHRKQVRLARSFTCTRYSRTYDRGTAVHDSLRCNLYVHFNVRALAGGAPRARAACMHAHIHGEQHAPALSLAVQFCLSPARSAFSTHLAGWRVDSYPYALRPH